MGSHIYIYILYTYIYIYTRMYVVTTPRQLIPKQIPTVVAISVALDLFQART